MLNLDHLPTAKSLLGITVPEMLYHYTNSGSLIQITTGGELWGGLPEQMNDAEEVARAFRWLNVIAGQFNLDMRESDDRDERMRFASWAERRTSTEDFGYLIRDSPKTYLVSLSRVGDSLSQWRAYCPRSGGYCIGLPGQLIRDAASSSGWLLAPCIYDESDVEAIMRELFDHHLTKWFSTIDSGAPFDPDNDTFTDGVIETVATMIEEARLIGHFIKNPTFEAEHEWRLLAFDHYHEADDLRYTSGTDGVRVFLPFDFMNGHAKHFPDEPRPSVRIGPNAHPESAKFAMRSLFERLVGPGNADVFTTSSSYR
ncbi:DUF2971 domain-containing protein [Gordonia polyisoprenivorans]|uniref:DUF2971 domain-containing protein n=1 Tax=Gordonia polyisoprenivorans TaxID=84595 RepID=UPI001AD6F0A8|nr:DUF2971 domain-containing protein [Gordonia polyisoprenivorans]QTI66882.1 DUF2971 domain-containing protein [Gordonia polyisoprenivorans]